MKLIIAFTRKVFKILGSLNKVTSCRWKFNIEKYADIGICYRNDSVNSAKANILGPSDSEIAIAITLQFFFWALFILSVKYSKNSCTYKTCSVQETARQ